MQLPCNTHADGRVLLDKQDGVARITLSRPERLNAMTTPMREQLGAHLDEVEADDAVRVVMLRGEGSSFCAGADLVDAPSTPFGWRTRILLAQSQHLQIARMRKPVVALVGGNAVGGGASMALAADILVMASDAKLVFPFVRLGLVPDGGSAFMLMAKGSRGIAMDLLMTGGTLDAAQAQAAGLTRRVVAPAELAATGEALAAELLALPPEGALLTKGLVGHYWMQQMAQMLAHEADAFALASSTDSHRQALAAMRARLTKKQGEKI